MKTNADRVEKWGGKAKKIIDHFVPLVHSGEENSTKQFIFQLALEFDEAYDIGRESMAKELRQLLNEGKE